MYSPWQENRCADSLANLEHCSNYVINFNEQHPFENRCVDSLANLEHCSNYVLNKF